MTLPRDQAARISAGENPLTVWRQHRGLRIAELAARVGMTANAVARCEQRRIVPKEEAEVLAEALGIQPAQLRRSYGTIASAARRRDTLLSRLARHVAGAFRGRSPRRFPG